MTPNFQKYLDYDIQSDNFVIKSSMTQQKIWDVPKQHMNITSSQDIIYVVNRFWWVSENSFKFITSSGIERLIEFDEDG
jgi:hypothetical protein